VTCPSCAAHQGIDATAGLAHCSACGHVWEVGASPAEPPARQPARLPAVPDGITRQPLAGGGVELRLPWGHRLDKRVHALWLLVVLPMAIAPSVGAFVLAVAAGGLWFLLTRNVTVVRVGPERIDVEHVPVPFPLHWSGSVSAASLGELVVQSRTEPLRLPLVKGHDGTLTTHTLRAGSRELLSGWRDHDRLAHVEVCIAEVAGVALGADPSAGPSSPLLPDRRPPAGVFVQTYDDVVELELPWSAHVTRVGVHLLWLLIFPGLWLGGLWGAVGLVLAVVWAYLAFNKTTVRLRDDAVEVHHGPLPNPVLPDHTLRHHQLTGLEITSDAVPIGRRSVEHHGLRAGSHEVLAYWLDRDKLAYVREAIVQAMEREA